MSGTVYIYIHNNNNKLRQRAFHTALLVSWNIAARFSRWMLFVLRGVSFTRRRSSVRIPTTCQVVSACHIKREFNAT